ncbi:G2/M phase-specific E3 ubiquitin-protein ligase-like [Acanthochromis polyacanthus]|uniref:G2/M phase-specific E3 ubiquitin-protein ligase-like n=1 Tax=Acanthochromis polyacanthus TaxID=80966 RepID=UPI002234A098|nr:G2/M phase-specific E3 ubiquitin-protein ligase-like [Acanthochromis polyacanthus]
MTTRARGNDTAKAPNISIRPFTRARAEQPSATLQVTDALVTTATQPPASQEAAVVIDLDSGDTVTQTPSNSSDDYAVYLSIMGMTSDLSDDDEELNQAIMASLESHEVLLNLASKIDGRRRRRFNINRTSVLDGALWQQWRGFRRPSYSPVYQMCIKFSDDLGKDEESVDLGGPRREFLRLLMEALALSPMFEGRDGKLNLALDSSALREDRYFVAGQAIAVSLVHGGPPPGFIAPTLYRCLVGGTSSAMPVLEDIADPDLYEKVKKVSKCTSLDDLIHSTEPLQDYLANAGCLRPLKCIKDKDQLVEDILMFQVVHRVWGAFERFREGLKTLGVLDAMRIQPDSFRPLMCHEPSPLTADAMDQLFHIRLSAVGSNKRMAEERIVAFWRDYLQDVEEQVGPSALGKILAFATGASVIPPVGFSPLPSVDFLHDQSISPGRHLPMANTCINCLKLPLLDTYEDFRESMDFALSNTQGFGRE